MQIAISGIVTTEDKIGAKCFLRISQEEVCGNTSLFTIRDVMVMCKVEANRRLQPKHVRHIPLIFQMSAPDGIPAITHPTGGDTSSVLAAILCHDVTGYCTQHDNE